MKRTKHNLKRKEPPKILIPKLPKRIFNILTSDEQRLYEFYCYMVEDQNTDQIYAKNSFVTNKNGLGWYNGKVVKAKKGLKRLGLIEPIQRHKEKGDIGRKGDFNKPYIKIFFTMDEDTLITTERQRRTTGRSISTNLKKINLKTPVSSIERSSNTAERQRRTKIAHSAKFTTNALKSIKNQDPYGTTSSGGIVPPDQKKDKKGIVPVYERREVLVQYLKDNPSKIGQFVDSGRIKKSSTFPDRYFILYKWVTILPNKQ